MSNPCICGSQRLFSDCCQPLLSGKVQAKTPESLMRSRYSAYALGGYGKYLLATWFPPMAKDLNVDDLSKVSQQWCGLNIVDTDVSGDDGSVEFKASYKYEDTIIVMHEKSVFKRIAGRWFYIGGEVSEQLISKETGRNEPCVCGSGKKFKKCCMTSIQ